MKMKNMTKRIASVALAVIMAVTFMPMLGDGGKAFASGGATIDSAWPLTLGKEVTGTAIKGVYFKYYKFTTTENQGVKYKIRVMNYSTDSSYINCNVYDKNGNVMENDIMGKGWWTVKPTGVPTVATVKNLKRNTTYYFGIKASEYDNDADFALKVYQVVPKPAKVSLNSVKAGKKKLTAKWSLVPYATKYQVNYRVKGTKTWKKVTTTNAYKTIKSLKSGKTYQVKVRALRVVDGKTHYGYFSKIKSVKVK